MAENIKENKEERNEHIESLRKYKWEIKMMDEDFSTMPEAIYHKIDNIAEDIDMWIEEDEGELVLAGTMPSAVCNYELFEGILGITNNPSELRKKFSENTVMNLRFAPKTSKNGVAVFELPLYHYCGREIQGRRVNKVLSFLEEFHCRVEKPTFPCRVSAAVYYKYLKLMKPEELERQRKAYRENKDEVDARLLNYSFGLLIPAEDYPRIPTPRLNQLRELIDNGTYFFGETSFNKYIDNKIINVRFVGKDGNGFNNLSEMLVRWIINPNGSSFYADNQEIMQAYFVLYLLKEGKYQEYYEKQKTYEASLEDIEIGSSYFACVTGNDTQAVKEKADALCMRIIQERLPQQTMPVEYTMFNLAESLAEIVPEVPGVIRYNPLESGRMFVINGIREFLAINSGNAPDSIFGRQIAHLLKELKQFKDGQYVIITGTESELKDFCALDRTLELKFGQHNFNIPDMTMDELYENFANKMPKDIKLNKKTEAEFKEYLSYNLGAFPLKNTALVNYLVNFSIEQGKFAMPQDLSNAKRKNFMQDLDDVVGMENVKKSIMDFYNYARFQKAAADLGAEIPRGNMHMVFTGNAGTGKTMTANIIAKALYDIGVVKENKVVIVERKDLVAEYVGQTAIKTSDVIEKAVGGVLFIDEAYSLNANHGKQNDFGGEAIATLLTAMESHQNDLIVIFAGYKKEMAEFLDMNPGLASRVGYTFNFKDYDENEMVEIFKKKVKKAGLTLHKDAEKPAKTLMQYFGKIPNIGNGRFAEKICQLAIRKHANDTDSKEFLEIGEVDIPTVKEVLEVLPDGENMINPEEITDDSKKKTAYHELGHAFVGAYYGETVKKITIEPSGMGWLGYVEYAPKMMSESKEGLTGVVSRCLAGMAAEKVFMGKHCSGVSDDLKKAKQIANSMVTEYGMGTTLSVDEKEVNNEVNKILDAALANAIEVIEIHKDRIEKASKTLLKAGTLEGKEINKVIKTNKIAETD